MITGLDYQQIRLHLAAILNVPCGTVTAAQRVLQALPLSESSRCLLLKDLLDNRARRISSATLFSPFVLAPQSGRISLDGQGSQGFFPKRAIIRCASGALAGTSRYSRTLAIDRDTKRTQRYEYIGEAGPEIVALIEWIDSFLKAQPADRGEGRPQKSVFTETLRRHDGIGKIPEKRYLIERELLEVLKVFQELLQRGERIDTLHDFVTVNRFHLQEFEKTIKQLPTHCALWSTSLTEPHQSLEKALEEIETYARATFKTQKGFGGTIAKLEKQRERIFLYKGVLDFILRLENALESRPPTEQTQIRDSFKNDDARLRQIIAGGSSGMRIGDFMRQIEQFKSFIVRKCPFRF